MFGSSARRPASNASTVSCTAVGSWYASVDPHHTITRRSQPFSVRKVSMSAMTCWARSHLLSPVLTRTPSRLRDPALVEHRRHRVDALELARQRVPGRARRARPQVRAASSALGEIGSQPPKTTSSRPASGTKSLIIGLRPSSRSPSRMWAIWVSEPIGSASPLRTASTPAYAVEATAPMPGVRIPRRPVAGAICSGSGMAGTLGPCASLLMLSGRRPRRAGRSAS